MSDISQGDSNTNLAYHTVRGGLWVALSSYWLLGFGFVINIMLTRLLAPRAFGVFVLAAFFTYMLRVQSKIGLGRAFIQHKETTDESLGTYFFIELLAALASLAIMLIATPILLRFGYTSTVVYVCVALSAFAVLDSIGGIGVTVLEKEFYFREVSILKSIVFPISYAPALWLALHGGGVWSIVAQIVCYDIMKICGVWWIIWKKLPHVIHMRWKLDRQLAHHFLFFGIQKIFVECFSLLLLTILKLFF